MVKPRRLQEGERPIRSSKAFRIPMTRTGTAKEKRRYDFRMAHHKELREQKERFSSSLPPPPPPGSAADPFRQEPFGDETSAREFSDADIKHYGVTVASIALLDGERMLFACSGTALPRGRSMVRVARFVTSARLVKEFNDKRNRDDNLSIQVRLHDDGSRSVVHNGFLGLYDDHIAIVSACIPFVHPVDVDPRERKFKPTHMVAAGRAVGEEDSRSLMVTAVSTDATSSEHLPVGEHRGLVPVTCDITDAGLGGPVIALVPGKSELFAGVIVSRENGVAYYLQTNALRRRLEHFQILAPRAVSFRGYCLPKGVKCVVPSGLWVTIQRLKSLGYPQPPPLVCELNGALVNTFEEDFGRLHAWEGYPFGVDQRSHGDYVWDELGQEIVTNVSRSVVSLSSFKGDVRCFACTGLLIKWHGSNGTRTVVLTSASLVRTNKDKIVKNLRIEVFLPQNQRVEGRLELYHQTYNIAIVSLKNCLYAIRPRDIFELPEKSPKVVVAIGRNPSKGLLMASKGEVEPSNKRCKLKCKALKLSTCRIKKAGIGGPLIDFDDGSFVGMNFYDESRTTPFLPRGTILEVLKGGFDLPSQRGLTRPVSLGNDFPRKNWWPVPEAYWYHGGLEVDKSVLPQHVGRVLQ